MSKQLELRKEQNGDNYNPQPLRWQQLKRQQRGGGEKHGYDLCKVIFKKIKLVTPYKAFRCLAHNKCYVSMCNY
jgi:hypothetical protein